MDGSSHDGFEWKYSNFLPFCALSSRHSTVSASNDFL